MVGGGSRPPSLTAKVLPGGSECAACVSGQVAAFRFEGPLRPPATGFPGNRFRTFAAALFPEIHQRELVV